MPASDRERGEGFQWVLVRLVTESASEGGEGFQLSVGLETLE